MFAAASDFATTTVSVATFVGAGSAGDIFDPPVDVVCVANDARKLVRSSTGEQVVSETTLYADPADAAKFTTDSKVTIGDRTARVIKTNAQVIGDPDVDHVEVVLT